MIRLLVVPKASNPYQGLLYGPMKDQVQVTYNKQEKWLFCTYPFMLFGQRMRGTRLIHLHWLYWLNVPFPNKHLQQLLTGLNIHVFLFLTKVSGYKIVWTVHNVLPHEAQTKNDKAIAQKISRLASHKIVHSTYALHQMQDLGMDTGRTTVIPHGNYIGVYPNNITWQQARKKLNIAKDEFAILFFGLIRPYKGVEDLLKAFKPLGGKYKARLIIAGSCSDIGLKQQIIRAQKTGNIDFFEGYIPDSEVATYFKSTDIVCLPFKAITTSGSALLTMSFGKPLIAPYSGALTDLPKNVGYLYDPEKQNALSQTLSKAMNNSTNLSRLGSNASAYAEKISWEKIANDTLSVYKEVV